MCLIFPSHRSVTQVCRQTRLYLDDISTQHMLFSSQNDNWSSGLRVDLPSAVSVVFSQSDLVSTTSSNERICTSSQEIASTMSLPDPSASITDSFPRVFKEFDFLEAEHDSVSETADSCFGWLSTMRPRSIGDEPPHDDDVDLDEDEVCCEEVYRSFIIVLLSYNLANQFRQGDNLNGVDEESIDGSSFCCRSRASVCELYSQKTPLTLSVYIQCPHHLDGKVLSYTVSHSCCGRVTSLLRDAMHILSSRSLTRTLAQAQDVLTEVADCPFLFVTAQYLRCSGVLSRLKLSLFELREHWETFNERKEQSIRVSSAFSFAYTLSPAVLDHQRELLICVADLPQRDLQPSVLSEHSGDSLVLLMTNKRYAQALHTLRQLRASFGQEFGCCEASDIDVLLLLFCRSHLLKAWALVGAVPDVLRRQSQCLRDANADMASAVRRLASDSASSHRTTVSSLTDSFQKISADS
uniref:Fry_C domain-containing protein n=1 Tax=Angiostrongylus cantonensis TaxID=6313 RepID=A0A158PCI2_ANGCA